MTPSQELSHYTYADLLRMDDDRRYELICGELILLSAPSAAHAAVSIALASTLFLFLRGKTCVARSAPLDVRLFEQEGDRPEDVDTVVQPDLIVCDHRKLTPTGVRGAPDLVVEILSPSTGLRDFTTKFCLYESAGVREYWIVDPVLHTVRVWLLQDGRLREQMSRYGVQDTVPVTVLPGCSIPLQDVFGEIQPGESS